MQEGTRKIQNLCILGSTGSIGTQTLDIVRLFPDQFRIKVLTAGKNAGLVIHQAREFVPDLVVVQNEAAGRIVKDALDGSGINVSIGAEALAESVLFPGLDTVVAGIVGFAGLAPVLNAVKSGRKIALANKETLVVAGEMIQRLARKHESVIIPVDSEHSALFQCLVGESLEEVESLILTASGGPFRTRSAETFQDITLQEALNHPNWNMGAKITIDSATMMNKGLEVIEARWLFDVTADAIDVLVHPQSIIHSMVAFFDGSVKAQLGVPDMKVPIQYALTFPVRFEAPHARLDWKELNKLTFEPPDLVRFPCLALAYEALKAGSGTPAVLNAANEAAVAAFLSEKISFVQIPELIHNTLDSIDSTRYATLEDLQDLDTAARHKVNALVRSATRSISVR